jgi:hypothetical protein
MDARHQTSDASRKGREKNNNEFHEKKEGRHRGLPLQFTVNDLQKNRVIANEVKQSHRSDLDCFVVPLLAMTMMGLVEEYEILNQY